MFMNRFIDVRNEDKEEFNQVMNHPLQTFEWGEFRKRIGTKVVRKALIDEKGKFLDGFTLTIHKVPFLPYNIGYVGKGNLPSKEILVELERIGKEEKCIYIQLEPNVTVEELKKNGKEYESYSKTFNIKPSFHPLFTKYTFILDLEKTEDQLMAQMYSKTRYNVRVAVRRRVEITESNSQESFNRYLKLLEETTTRQKFYAHNSFYHKSIWEILKDNKGKNNLQYQLLEAFYTPESEKKQILVAWVIFMFKDTMYYPYGASSRKHREVMASNLIAWEAIKLGKKNGMKKFDMWGALGPEPNKDDPWYGFHRFKEGYGSTLTEFIGNYDLVINPLMYKITKQLDKARWLLLSLKKRLF